MRPRQCLLLVPLWLSVAAGPAWGLELGDPAPPLQVKEWVKGKPVNLADGRGKNIYVIEFWATWCRPCLESIPFLTALQQKYRDQGVVVVAVTSKDLRQRLVDVIQFVRQMGDRMDYTVAYDDGAKTSEAYLGGFNINGIPCTFVVDQQGRIVWVGHTTHQAGRVVEGLLSGKFNFEEYRRLLQTRQQALPLLERYLRLVSSSAPPEPPAKLAEQFMPLIEKDAEFLEGLAWQILVNPEIKDRDLKLALRAARMAHDLTGGNDALALDTYARALWDNDQRSEAIEVQKKAIQLVQDERIKRAMEETLRRYERDAGR